MIKKYYAHDLAETRPDTRMIEAKLRQYFELTDQRYEPLEPVNVMLVSFRALSMLARSEKERREMNEQWHRLVSMSVITTKEKALYIVNPFAVSYALPTEDGSHLAAEINWNPYEAMNNHRSFRHSALTEDNIAAIRAIHGECAERLKGEYETMLESLRCKYAK